MVGCWEREIQGLQAFGGGKTGRVQKGQRRVAQVVLVAEEGPAGEKGGGWPGHCGWVVEGEGRGELSSPVSPPQDTMDGSSWMDRWMDLTQLLNLGTAACASPASARRMFN